SGENATLKRKLDETETRLAWARMERDMVERRLYASYRWNKRFYMEMVRIGTVPKPPSNDEVSIPSGRPFPAGRRNSVSVSAGWRNSAARPMEDEELLLSPQQVILGETGDHICKGGPRTMVDLNNLHGLTLIDPLDSGCSRSMSGNKERLDDFVEIKGGTVTFGGPHWDAQSLSARLEGRI
ncbi:hypothetical protein Tco_0076469, partial [Tanacetum coccineum]